MIEGAQRQLEPYGLVVYHGLHAYYKVGMGISAGSRASLLS